MDVIFEDKTPLWKIISVSIIAAIGIFYPFLKKGNSFEFGDIIKHQKVEIEIKQDVPDSFFEKLKEILIENNYSIEKEGDSSQELKFSSKFSWKTFGERYSLTKSKSKLILISKPKFGFDILDYGIAKKKIAELSALIQNSDN